MGIKKIVFFIIVISSFFIINNLIRSIYTLWQKQHLVVNARSELDRAQDENRRLKGDLSVVNKPAFVEEEARNKLFLGKPGEKLIVMPSVVLEASPTSVPVPVDRRPNWLRWWKVFF